MPNKLVGAFFTFLLIASFVSADSINDRANGFDFTRPTYTMVFNVSANGLQLISTNQLQQNWHPVNRGFKWGVNFTVSTAAWNNLEYAEMAFCPTTRFYVVGTQIIISTNATHFDVWDTIGLPGTGKIVTYGGGMGPNAIPKLSQTCYVLNATKADLTPYRSGTKMSFDPMLWQDNVTSPWDYGAYNQTKKSSDDNFVQLANSSGSAYYSSGTYFGAPWRLNDTSAQVLNLLNWTWKQGSGIGALANPDSTTNITMNVRTKNYSFNTTGLSAWYDLGDSSDNDTTTAKALDLSGNGQIATPGNWGGTSNPTLNTTCVIGNCMNFLGSASTGSYYDMRVSVKSDSGTVAVWAYPRSYGGASYTDPGMIIGWDEVSPYNVLQIYPYSLGGSFYGWYIDGVGDYRIKSPSLTPPLNTWTLVVLTWNSTSGTMLYFNTSKMGEYATLPAGYTLSYGGIGYFPYGATYLYAPWDGLIDDVKVWNRTISYQEIVDLYNSGNPTGAGGQEKNFTAWSSSYNANASLGNSLIGNIAQYRVILNSSTNTLSPFLQNVTLTYGIAGGGTGPVYVPPVCSINSPVNFLNVSGSSFIVNYSANSSLNNFGNSTLLSNFSGVWTSNISNGSQILNGSYSNNFTPVGIAEGRYIYGVRVWDANGTGYCGNQTVTLDRSAPNYIRYVSTNNTLQNSQYNVTVNYTIQVGDALTSVSNATTWAYNVNGSTYKSYSFSNTSLANGSIITYNLTLTQNGTVNFTTQLCDILNNCANYSGFFATFNITTAAPPDTQAPQWFDNQTNETKAGNATNFSVRWTDNIALYWAVLELDNGNGTLQNVTNLTLSGTNTWSNYTRVLNSTINATIRWRVYASDTSGVLNTTNLMFFNTSATYATPDIQAPKWFSNQTNQTKADNATLFSVYWTDDRTLARYIFEFDNGTGTLANITNGALSGSAAWVNVSLWINQTINSTIRWRVWANDTTSNMNVTPIMIFNTTALYAVPIAPAAIDSQCTNGDYQVNKAGQVSFTTLNDTSIIQNAVCTISIYNASNTALVQFALMSNSSNGLQNYTLNVSKAGAYKYAANCTVSEVAVFAIQKDFSVASSCSALSLAANTLGGGNMILDFTLIAFLTIVSLAMIAIGYFAQSKMLMAIGGIFLMVTGGLFFDTRAGLGIQTYANTTTALQLASDGSIAGTSIVNNYAPLQNEYIGGLGLAYLMVGFGVLLILTLQFIDERKRKPKEFESQLEVE